MKADSINISARGEQNVYEDKVAALMADARVRSLGYKDGAFVLPFGAAGGSGWSW